MIDMTTTFLGRALRSPLGCSASPLCDKLDNLKRMEDCGAGIVVLSSLFEEQLECESAHQIHWTSFGAESLAQATRYYPELTQSGLGPEEYLRLLELAKEQLDIPVVGSLNGVTVGGWLDYARQMQKAGAAAIELNLYAMPTSPDETSALLEARYREVVAAIASEVTIPIAVKLSPFLTAPLAFARRLDDAGAKGIVLFNRFHQPDFDLETMQVTPRIDLSHPSELALRLHWTAILFGHVRSDLAITGGVHTAEAALKSLAAGARVAMLTSALLSRGIEALADILEGMRYWLESHEQFSIRKLQGSMSLAAVPNPEIFERMQYIRTLRSYGGSYGGSGSGSV